MKKLVVAVSVVSVFGFGATAMAKDASEIYKGTCSPCHGPAGEGKKPMGPALKGNENVTKAADADLKNLVKNGRAGADKKYKEFPSPMPAQKALTDAEIDGIVKYIKTDLQK